MLMDKDEQTRIREQERELSERMWTNIADLNRKQKEFGIDSDEFKEYEKTSKEKFSLMHKEVTPLRKQVAKYDEDKWLETEGKDTDIYGYDPEREDARQNFKDELSGSWDQMKEFMRDKIEGIMPNLKKFATDELREEAAGLVKSASKKFYKSSESESLWGRMGDIFKLADEKTNVYGITKAKMDFDSAIKDISGDLNKLEKVEDKIWDHLANKEPSNVRWNMGGSGKGLPDIENIRYITTKCINKLPNEVRNTVRVLNGQSFMREVEGNLYDDPKAKEEYESDGSTMPDTLQGYYKHRDGDCYYSDTDVDEYAIHEMAHGIHFEYIKRLKPSIAGIISDQFILYESGLYNKFPTMYSRKNENEFFATCFEWYFNKPFMLGKHHKEMYELIHNDIIKGSKEDSVITVLERWKKEEKEQAEKDFDEMFMTRELSVAEEIPQNVMDLLRESVKEKEEE